VGKEKKKDEKDSMDIEATEQPAVQPTREIIGFVTAGDFAFSKGKGFAQGFVCTKLFEKQLHQAVAALSSAPALDPKFVLIRNVTSRHYIPAFLTVP